MKKIVATVILALSATAWSPDAEAQSSAPCPVDYSGSGLTDEQIIQLCDEAAAYQQASGGGMQYYWFNNVSYRYYLSDGCGGGSGMPCPEVP